MKKKLLLVLVIFFITLSSNVVYSQVSKSIVDTTKQWNIEKRWRAWGTCAITEIQKIINEDTIVNGKTYYKLINKSDTTINTDWTFLSWIREDNGKVFVFTNRPTSTAGNYDSNPKEYTLFDFNISIGDTFTPTREPYIIPGLSNDASLVAKNIDSVIINN